MPPRYRLLPLAAALLTTVALVQHGKIALAGRVGPDFVYNVTPCRILDTRIGAEEYSGKLNPGEALALQTSNWVGTISKQGGSVSGCPDIEANATGVFINVIAVEASGSFNNDLGIQPWGSTSSGTAINYTPGVYAINNGLFVGTCWGQFISGFAPSPNDCLFDLQLRNGTGASAHVVIDVTGFTRDF